MKKLIFITQMCLLAFISNGQCINAYIDTVNATVVHKYITIGKDIYCIGPTLLILGNDTLYFYNDAIYNKVFIRNYPFLEQYIGTSDDYSYDVFYDAVCQIPKHNLAYSEHNYLANPYLSSISLYKKDNDNSVYSIYNFYGTVVFYEGVKEGVKRENYDFNEFDYLKDCPCLNLDVDYRETERFAVLKETFELSQLSTKQEQELNLCKSNMNKIRILICE